MSLRNNSGQVYENKISEINAKILMQKKKKNYYQVVHYQTRK